MHHIAVVISLRVRCARDFAANIAQMMLISVYFPVRCICTYQAHTHIDLRKSGGGGRGAKSCVPGAPLNKNINIYLKSI